MDLTSNPEKAKQEMEMFATTYFNQFQKTRWGHNPTLLPAI